MSVGLNNIEILQALKMCMKMIIDEITDVFSEYQTEETVRRTMKLNINGKRVLVTVEVENWKERMEEMEESENEQSKEV